MARTKTEESIIQMALGRIFRLGSRPAQPGDMEEYERCLAVILSLTEPPAASWSPRYARDRLRGAQGD